MPSGTRAHWTDRCAVEGNAFAFQLQPWQRQPHHGNGAGPLWHDLHDLRRCDRVPLGGAVQISQERALSSSQPCRTYTQARHVQNLFHRVPGAFFVYEVWGMCPVLYYRTLVCLSDFFSQCYAFTHPLAYAVAQSLAASFAGLIRNRGTSRTCQ
jgi:hypothetical protein